MDWLRLKLDRHEVKEPQTETQKGQSRSERELARGNLKRTAANIALATLVVCVGSVEAWSCFGDHRRLPRTANRRAII